MTKISSPEYLLALSTHFAQEDWKYTRLHHIKHIRYDDDYRGHDAIPQRLRRALRGVFHRRRRDMLSNVPESKWWHLLHYKLVYLRVQMRTETHLPDGVLHKGCIITQWEEDGEYIQMIQPSVGELLAEFLIDQPDNPWAQKITAEMDRILDDYTARAKEGEVDGRKR